MTEPLRIEISHWKPGAWKVVERSYLSTTESVSKVNYNEAELKELLAEVGHAFLDVTVGMEKQSFKLRRLGYGLAALTLPPRLREKISTSNIAVEFFLDDESICLPVELFPNSDGVLADQIPVSRHWSCEHDPVSMPSKNNPMKHALIVGDPNETLSGAQQEGEQLCRLFRSFGKDWHCCFLGRSVSVAELARELPDSDLLHLAGHYAIKKGEFSTEEGFVMADGLWMPQSMIESPQFVFANCCKAGLPSSTDNTLSLVGRLLQRGASQIIAPFLPAPDGIAKLFAVTFYENFLKEHNAAAAVLKARRTIGPASWMYWYFGSVTSQHANTKVLLPKEHVMSIPAQEEVGTEIIQETEEINESSPSGCFTKIGYVLFVLYVIKLLIKYFTPNI